MIWIVQECRENRRLPCALKALYNFVLKRFIVQYAREHDKSVSGFRFLHGSPYRLLPERWRTISFSSPISWKNKVRNYRSPVNDWKTTTNFSTNCSTCPFSQKWICYEECYTLTKTKKLNEGFHNPRETAFPEYIWRTSSLLNNCSRPASILRPRTSTIDPGV